MPDHDTYEYAIIRVVPRVEREEFVNAGAIVFCPARAFLEARVELDGQRLAAIDPRIDLECVRRHLQAIEAICAGSAEAGEIGRMSQRERFEWLVSPRSTLIQTSAAHTGHCANPSSALEHLLQTMVRQPPPASLR